MFDSLEVLRKTLERGRVKGAGSVLILMLISWPLTQILATSGASPPYYAWFALNLFFLGPVFLLFAVSVLHEMRRLAIERSWKVNSSVEGYAILLLLVGTCFVAGLAHFLTHWVLGSLFALEQLGLCLSVLTLCWAGFAIDHRINRRFTVTPIGVSFAIAFLLALCAIWIASGTWGDWATAANLMQCAAMSGVVAVGLIVVLYASALHRAGERIGRREQTSPTRGLQFRYVKALVVFSFTSGVIFFVVFYFASWADLDSRIRFDVVMASASPGGEEVRARALGHTYLGGLSWVISLPLIVLVFALVGLLYVQDASRDRWVRKLRHWQESGKSRTKARLMLESLLEDLSTAVAAIVTTIQRHPLPVSIGFSLNVLFSLSPGFYSNASPLQGLGVSPDASSLINPFVLLNIWIGSLLLWGGPLVASLTDLHGTLTWAIKTNVSRSLSRAEDHVVLVGYGDLARRVIRGLFDSRVLDVNYDRDCWDLVLPNGARAALLQGIVAVDINQEAFEITFPVGGSTAGVIRLDVDPFDTGPTPAFGTYILGVCGDANQRQSLEAARSNYARNVVCLARDSDAVYSVTDYLRSSTNRKSVAAVFSAHGSSAPAFLAYRAFTSPVAFLHLAQARGAVMGQTIANALEGLEDEASPKKVLLIGSSSEALYIVEGLTKAAGSRANSILNPTLGIQSDSDYYELRLSPDGGKKKWRGWRVLQYEPMVGFQNQIGLPETGLKPNPLKLRFVRRDPGHESSVLQTIRDFRPDVIAIAEQSASRQLRIVRAAYGAISLYHESLEDPETQGVKRLVVAIETGRPGRADNAGDAMAYFYRRQRIQGSSLSVRYPRQFGFSDHLNHVLSGDLAVDVLDDPSTRIVSIMQAHRRPASVEVGLCLRSYPGALAWALCMAAGLKPESTHTDYLEAEKPSLSGTRMFTGRANVQYITATARLRKGAQPESSESAVTRASLLPNGNTAILPDLEQLFPGMLQDTEHDMGDASWWCKDCPEMSGCTVVTHRKTAITRMSSNNHLTTPYYWRGATEGMEPLDRDFDSESIPARVVCSVNKAERSGALATVLSFLRFTKAVPRYTSPAPTATPKPILNLRYVMDEPCHSYNYSVVTLHGNLEHWPGRKIFGQDISVDRDRHDDPDGVLPLGDMVLRPMGDFARWEEYARKLASFACGVLGLGRDCVSLTKVKVVDIGPRGSAVEHEDVLLWLRIGPARQDQFAHQSELIKRARHGNSRCSRCNGGRTCLTCKELNAALGELELESAARSVLATPVAFD